jgi:Ca-activated chloride channel family protein
MTFRPLSSPENQRSSRPRKVVAPLATTALVAAFGAWHSLQAQQTPEALAHAVKSRAPHRPEAVDSTAPTRGERLAQGDILPRERWPHPPWPHPWPQPALQQELRLVSQQARVRVDDAAARTTITQVFENTTGRTIEGTYLFPLPAGAAVSDFAMTVNGKRVEAEILDRDKARGIYEGIVAKMRDPAILEFTDRNLLRARIFPVAAGDRPKVELSYAEALKPESGGDTGSFRYVLPLRLPVGGTAREASVDAEINSRRGLRGVYSPTHKVEVARDPANANRARVSGEFKPGDAPTPASTSSSTSGDTGRADRDFVLYFSTGAARVGVSPVVFESAGEDPYFMLLVAPDPKIDAREVAAKDVVFVCDTSGSMEGDKIVQARKAVRNLVGLLNPADRFNVVTFSSDVRLFRDNLIPASAANIEEARGWADKIKAVGGTNINDSLVEALKMFGDTNGANAQRARQVVFMTDGQPTVGETDIAQILKNVRDANALSGARSDGVDPFKARLFTFGVGYDVNTRLLDTLAEDNRGSSDYVLPEEDIEVKVGGLYRKISFPVLSAPRLDWGGQKVYDVYPRRLPDLFRGTQAVVFGRIDGTFSPTARVQLTGSSGGRESRVAGDPWGGGDARNDALPRLWAARKIGFLIDDARLNDRPIDGEVRDEVIKLSKKYGIVTPLTAALITEDTPGFPRTQIAGGHLDAGGNFNAAGQRRGGWQSAGEAIAGAAPASPAPDMAAKSGAGAVAVSRARREMKEADRVDDARADVRFVAGKSFFQQNGQWIDTAFDAAKSPKPERIAFGSDAYWKLLREAAKTEPGLPKWLAVGDSIVIALRGRTVEIVPAAK